MFVAKDLALTCTKIRNQVKFDPFQFQTSEQLQTETFGNLIFMIFLILH